MTVSRRLFFGGMATVVGAAIIPLSVERDQSGGGKSEIRRQCLDEPASGLATCYRKVPFGYVSRAGLLDEIGLCLAMLLGGVLTAVGLARVFSATKRRQASGLAFEAAGCVIAGWGLLGLLSGWVWNVW